VRKGSQTSKRPDSRTATKEEEEAGVFNQSEQYCERVGGDG